MRKLYLLVPFLTIPFVVSCSNNANKLTFAQREYLINSGDAVTINEKIDVTYEFLNKVDEDIKLDSKTGVITFNQTECSNRQVYYRAYTANLSSDPVTITLSSEVITPTLEISNPTNYISNGDYIVANSSTNSSILYSLKEDIGGVSIDSTSGRVSFTSLVEDDLEFEVVATSHNITTSRKFVSAVNHLVSSIVATQAKEVNTKQSISYVLDFSDAPATTENKIIGIYHKKHLIDTKYYTYIPETHTLTISSDGLTTLTIGENTLRIITPRNAVQVEAIIASKFIKTPEDLASINSDRNLLNGYLLLANDIDLTSYFNDEERGYNGGKYWTPIGLYHDVTDGTATKDAFGGTFNGNGYTISGFLMNRKDEYGFNAGLFGYLNGYAHIKNVSLTGIEMDVASYSGGFVGVNYGKIENCFVQNSVKASTGDMSQPYQCVGGFVGRNFGTIDGCVSYSTAMSDKNVGLFCGINDGIIKNSYALRGISTLPFTSGNEPINCKDYTDFNAFAADFNNTNLDKEVWSINAGILLINREISFFKPYSILLSSNYLSYYRGETIDYSAKLVPNDLHDKFINQVKFAIIGEGATLDTNINTIFTTSETSEHLSLVASLDLGEFVINETIEFTMYNAIETISFDEIDTTVEPGKRYRFSFNITPDNANEDVVMSSSLSKKFVFFKDDVMTISSDISLSKMNSFTLTATTKKTSAHQTINIHYPLTISKASYMLYQGSEKDVVVTLPDGQDYTNAQLYRFSKTTNLYTIQGKKLYVDKANFEGFIDSDVAFVLKLSNGEFINFVVTYVSHSPVNENEPNNPILISTKEEFKLYFNISSYDPSKYQNYKRDIVITRDISFGGELIKAIGYSEEGKYFTGRFFGFGHTISDFEIHENEEQYITPDPTYYYRSSLYNVGFFAKLGGKVYDVNFVNANIHANAYIGGLTGNAEEGSHIENVHFFNSVITNSQGQDYTDRTIGQPCVTGRIAGRLAGTMVGCSYNQTTIGLSGD